jgi:hypothetical protein
LQLHVNGTLVDQQRPVGSSSSLHASVSFNWKVSQYGSHTLVVSLSPSTPALPPPPLISPASARVWIVAPDSLAAPAAPAFLFAPPALYHGEIATFVAEYVFAPLPNGCQSITAIRYAFDAEDCALVMGIFVDGELIASAAGPQLAAQFKAGAGGSGSTAHHEVMLLMILSGSNGPYALPPIIKSVSLKSMPSAAPNGSSRPGGVQRAADSSGVSSGEHMKYLTFQATFGQFNNKRVSLMNASTSDSSCSRACHPLPSSDLLAQLHSRTF